MEEAIFQFESEEYATEKEAHDWQYLGLIKKASETYLSPDGLKKGGQLWRFDYEILSYEVRNAEQGYKAIASIRCSWK